MTKIEDHSAINVNNSIVAPADMFSSVAITAVPIQCFTVVHMAMAGLHIEQLTLHFPGLSSNVVESLDIERSAINNDDLLVRGACMR